MYTTCLESETHKHTCMFMCFRFKACCVHVCLCVSDSRHVVYVYVCVFQIQGMLCTCMFVCFRFKECCVQCMFVCFRFKACCVRVCLCVSDSRHVVYMYVCVFQIQS